MKWLGDATRRWFVRLEWKVQDCWVGVFWKRTVWSLDVWVCLLPMVPLHFGWQAQIAHHPLASDPAPSVDSGDKTSREGVSE